MTPKDARAVLVGAQAGVDVDLSGIMAEDKTIQVAGQSIKLKVIRPADAQGMLPVFMYFHGG
jgi:acetyl esterase